jgi:hypothetical protein
VKSRNLRWLGLLVCCLLAGGLVSVWLRQDANWDLRNYHLSNAWAYLHDRLSVDLFPAGTTTYFSPYIDLPYYFLSMRWLPNAPGLVAFIMGLPFGALVFFVTAVAWIASLDFDVAPRVRALICLAGAGFGLSGVSVVSQIGTTTNEIQVGAIVLAGLCLLLLAGTPAAGTQARRTGSLLLLSGLLFGVAAGLKMTAAVYAPGAGVAVLLRPGALKTRIAGFSVFSLACMIAFLLVWGPWGLEIYRLTGNPVFPMFNDIFRSSWMAADAGRDLRFMPAGAVQAIFYPFYWITPNTTVMELAFADARFAIALALAFAALLLGAAETVSAVVRKRKPRGPRRAGNASGQLIAFFLISYIVWEILFSILRYTAALESISGVVSVATIGYISKSFPLPSLVKIGGALVLAVFAGLTTKHTLYPNWGRVDFGPSVLHADVPELAKDATIIYADQPTAFTAPFIWKSNPTADFIAIARNFFVGRKYVGFGLEGRIKDRIAGSSHIYVAYYQSSLPPDRVLSQFGVSVDYGSCRSIHTNISEDLNICAAQRDQTTGNPVPKTYKLIAVFAQPANAAGITVGFTEGCVSAANPTVARIAYDLPDVAGRVKVYFETPPGPPVLFANTANVDQLKTGAWVHAGQTLLFTNDKGQPIAKANLQYRACN